VEIVFAQPFVAAGSGERRGGFERDVGNDRRRAVPDEAGEGVDIVDFAGLDDDVGQRP
jgi:hypothetical protein